MLNALTAHARKRCQQRGIPPLIVEWLFEFGRDVHKNGAELIYFDKKSRRALRKYAGRQVFRMLDKYMDSYLVTVDGKIVTVGHRTKPIHCD